MKPHAIFYTDVAVSSIRHLPPLTKPMIKKLIEKLADNPWKGKPLRAELQGYYSARFQRWRVIYTISNEPISIIIHLIEKRVSVYDSLRNLVKS